MTDAQLAARLLAQDLKLGGIILRGDGPERDAMVAELRAMLPVRRLPPNIDDEGLVGGRDLTALLAGRTEHRRGLLAEADGGLLLVPMAERMDAGIAARIAATMDAGEVEGEVTRFGLVLLDDGRDEETVPAALAERCAFRFDFRDVLLRRQEPRDQELSNIAEAPAFAGAQALVETALALGIDSMRAPLLAQRVAKLTDVETAARLVLAHRATQLPAEAPHEDAPEPQNSGSAERLEDQIIAATVAAIPGNVLAAIAAGRTRSAKGAGQGARRRAPTRGRALGSRAGMPRGGKRLAIIDTLRAAAPWQAMRERDGPVEIRKDDLRIRRFETKSAATTIFAVDASGSAAAARLGEAKGAVELLLAQAYAKRTEVALIAFRGEGAEVLLPPTRSLTRARRLLGDLPGGGGTPLAAGLDAARLMAESVRARGRTPFVVVLSDGRANVGQGDPTGEARAAAKRLGGSGVGSVFVDIAQRPRAEAAGLAEAMGARYLPLPNADAARLSTAIAA